MSYSKRPLQARKAIAGALGNYNETEMALPYCGDLTKDSTQICRSQKDASGSGFGDGRGSSSSGVFGTINSWFTTPSSSTPAPPATTKPTSSSGGVLSDLAKVFGALAISKLGANGQPVPTTVIAPSTGISPTTMLIGGGLAVTALVLLLKK